MNINILFSFVIIIILIILIRFFIHNRFVVFLPSLAKKDFHFRDLIVVFHDLKVLIGAYGLYL